MAPQVTHYRITVSAPCSVDGINFKMDGRYTVTSAIRAALIKERGKGILRSDEAVT